MIDDRHARGSARPPGGGPRSVLPDEPSGAFDRNDPLLGAWIERRFTIIERMAQGGMGKVYKAVQSPMGRIVALKVLSPLSGEGRKDEFHQRFFLEAATAARLVHPNTVTVYDYGNSGDLYYIVMEFLDGTNLRRILNDERRLHPVRVRHIAMQICRSLQEAHGIGVIHRDLKPENIIVLDTATHRDHVKVVDFGLAKAFRGEGAALHITGEGLAIGSPTYMAPEQILGDPISPATDVYALGTLLFEMLTGDAPFAGRSPHDTLMGHVHEPPPTLPSRLADRPLHPGWQPLVGKCLAKDPADRFHGMDELLAALKVLPGPSPASRPSTAPALPHPGSSAPAAPSRPAPASILPHPALRASPAFARHVPTRLVVAAVTAAIVVALALAAMWLAWHR